MIKTILTFIKYGVVIAFGLVFISFALEFLGLLDFTLVAYAVNIITQLDLPLSTIFDYPNVMLLLGFLVFVNMLLIFLDFIVRKVRE